MGSINTAKFSLALRQRGMDAALQRLLISKFTGSEQEKDLTEPPNCGGFGRIRHFRRFSTSWPPNPLPIDPAQRFLGLATSDGFNAQVFQNAICNWRCWYCFVPFELLAGREENGGWKSAKDLVDLYLAEPLAARPPMIDLTGGQPDLVPEWTLWMMQELRRRGLEGSVYLWSDDNLSTDYLWKYLTPEDHEFMRTFRGYGRVACFKGFDEASFAFNTKAEPALFDQQFELFGKLLAMGLDIYAYTTFTAANSIGIEAAMARFVDRLQELHENLPLRTVPLKIGVFGVVKDRLRRLATIDGSSAILNQQIAINAWNAELERRFTSAQRALSIVDVSLA